MHSPSENNWLSDHLKNKWVRFPLLIVLYSIAAFVVFLLGKTLLGYNVKLFGIETSPEKRKDDTTATGHYKIIHDTIKNFVVPEKIDLLKKNKDERRKSNDKVDTTKSVKYEIKGTFNAPAQIGDGNTQNNYAPVPREVSKELISMVERSVIDKSSSITIYRRNGDAESSEFAYKIIKALNKIGYFNVTPNGIISDRIIGGNLEEAEKQQQEIGYKWMNGVFAIIIPSNK